MSENMGLAPPENPPIQLTRKMVSSGFKKRVNELSGQPVDACYQCGNCSSGCPLAQEMAILPNRIIRLVQLGQKDDIIHSNTIWICASCFQCTVRCPKGIDIQAVMDTLRQIALEEGVDHFGPDQIDPALAAEVPQPGLVGVYRKLST
ncbi:MAG: 4Fe-4S dicluster domain-containing protein [Candidatus Aegiribacteria sp.]|nr:4Fe-4S dicluster domain-containing protein [Candidatus Aegiribacteria sp.]